LDFPRDSAPCGLEESPLSPYARSTGFWIGLAALFALLASACDEPTDRGPRIDAVVSPSSAVTQQNKWVILAGAGFGLYEAGRSTIFVDGVCAEVATWNERELRFLVPSGIGLGNRVVVVVRADGRRAHTARELTGVDLPAPTTRSCDSLQPIAVYDVVEDRFDDVLDLSDTDVDWTWDTASPPDVPHDLRPDVPMEVPPDVPWDTTPPPPWQYQYVLIQDFSGNAIGRNPGADIDALVLRKVNGEMVFASDVWLYEVGPNSVTALEPTEALGYPDAYPYFPDLSWCDVQNGTVSLGGSGLLVVSMPEPIEPGDELDIYEVGGCEYAPGMSAIPEVFLVSIGVKPELDTKWFELGDGAGPVASFQIPELPMGP